MPPAHSGLAPAILAARLEDARARLEALVDALPGNAWVGPFAPTLNPPLWELGHIAWFQELWCLRLKPGVDPFLSPLLEPLLPSRCRFADWLYDSSRIPHAVRWHAPLPDADATRAFAAEVHATILAELARGALDDARYYVELSLYHELMHLEAWWMAWQWHGFAPPALPALPALGAPRSLRIEAATVMLGSHPNAGFVFDNEKWAHEAGSAAFDIDAQPVTCGEFAEFVAAGGYARPELWSDAGRTWLAGSAARHPLYWQRTEGAWHLRRFDRWIELPSREPVIHVNRHEAEAWCAWRGRTLPSAAQWLRASTADGFVLGRCWEWTRDAFAPYRDFSPDPYSDYSAPWFYTHAELRGAGSWVTDAALARPTFRNFYTPERSDPFAGFRSVGRGRR